MKRAIGIVRVSRVGGREGERFISPEIQRERIATACDLHGLKLLDTTEELDTSGGKPLAQRKALSQALASVEGGMADAIVFAYRDRADRSIVAGAELCQRVDAAGGLLIAGGNLISHATHDGWRRATFESFLNEDQRRAVGEKMRDVHERCIARGAPPWARVQLGYVRQDDGTLAPKPDEVPIVRRAFEMRAQGASIMSIRAMLSDHGITRSYRGVQVLLASRIPLGELRFGRLSNLHAHEPIIDEALWKRAQRMKVPRGPQAQSPQLLARLRVLRCGSCGSPMGSMNMQKQGPIYRCGSTNVCEHHMTISVAVADQVIVAAVRKALRDVEGKASLQTDAREAAQQAEGARKALDAAIVAFDGFDLESARSRLIELREAAESAQARADDLGAASAGRSVNGSQDWDRLTFDEQRELIALTVKRAVVGPGRGAERITVELFGE